MCRLIHTCICRFADAYLPTYIQVAAAADAYLPSCVGMWRAMEQGQTKDGRALNFGISLVRGREGGRDGGTEGWIRERVCVCVCVRVCVLWNQLYLQHAPMLHTHIYIYINVHTYIHT